MTRNRLYLLLTTLLTAGYAYLTIALLFQDGYSGQQVNACPVKAVTGIPCPSCGSTRSVISILHSNFTDALLLNPLGYIIAVVMLVLPLWLIFDVLLDKATLHKAYKLFEAALWKKPITIILIILIIANWIWNITKGL